jgi:hypothetical protein
MRQDRGAREDHIESREVQDARRRVMGALECLERSERDALDELQHAVCRYVTALRDAGVSAAETTELVTAIVTAPATREGSFAMIPAVRAALVELAVGWCVTEYGRLDKKETDRASPKMGGSAPGESIVPPA